MDDLETESKFFIKELVPSYVTKYYYIYQGLKLIIRLLLDIRTKLESR